MAEKLVGKELGGVYIKNKNGGVRINLHCQIYQRESSELKPVHQRNVTTFHGFIKKIKVCTLHSICITKTSLDFHPSSCPPELGSLSEEKWNY